MTSEADSLTADDLRNKLYHSLREKGLVDALKSQLRNRLVSELQSVGLSQSFHKSQSLYAKDGSLIARAADSLVADHLRHSGCDYTLSVFLPESGTVEEKIFKTRDLLRLLNISQESSLYKKLARYNSEGLDKKGFLWQLLCEVAKHHGHTKQEVGIQTDKASNALITTLEEEFKRLDQHYATPEVARGMQAAVEERMLSYQRQVEERARTEISLEIARFKETDVARIRMEEREKYRKETDRTRKELERTYQSKVDALVERERNSIERLQSQQGIAEKETFAQRQSILEEIDIMRQREAELRRQMELNLREKSFWEDKVKSQEELVKKREEAVRRKEVEYEQRLHDEVNKFKTEQDAKYLTRNKDIEYREIRLKEDERRVHEDLSDIKLVKDELREKRIKVNTLDADLQRAMHDLLTVRNQNELLSEKIRDMVDYTTLKDDNTGLHRDLKSTKSRLAETQRDLQIERQKREEVLREMGERLSKPTPDHMSVQTELDRARGSLRHEQALHQHQLQQGQIKIHEQVDRNRDLLRKYDEQSLQMKEMNREIRDMRYQLTHTRSALDNEVYGKPSKSYIHRSHVRSRSPSLCDLNDPAGLDDFLEPLRHSPEPGLYSATEPELLITKDILPSKFHIPGHNAFYIVVPSDDPVSVAQTDASKSDDYSYSSDLIEDTKKRLRRLEKEAENLEQTHQNFNFRMTSVHTSLLPTGGMVSNHRDNRDVRSYCMRENKATVNTNHSARPAYTSHAALSLSSDRPLSSTPNRQPHPMSYRPYTPPPHDGLDPPKLNMDVSPVHSNPDLGRTTVVRKNQPISIEDLEARPGSPSVVVVEASVLHPDRTSPQGQERSEQPEPRCVDTRWKGPGPGLDNAWKEAPNSPSHPPNGPTTLSPVSAQTRRWDDSGPLTSTQKPDQSSPTSQEDRWRLNEEDQRRRELEEDREFEERKQRREEEKAWKEQEAWEREQQELERLQTGGLREKETESEKKEESGPAIDPVMQKYMDMVAAQKQKEKSIAKKTLSTWNKGRALGEDKTPSVSDEISAADDKSETGAVAIDDDFDW